MAHQNRYFPQSVPHPGEVLAEKLEELDMPRNEFALRSGKPEKTIIAILKGESSITPDMAVQFENVTRIPAHYWMNHQRLYDEYLARLRRQSVIDRAQDWTENFPVGEMIKKGWIPSVKSLSDRTIELLAFFGFSHHEAWEEYYFNQQLKVAFRISLAQTKEPFAISAWLRRGELQAAAMEANDYSEKKFKEVLPQLKSMMVSHPGGFFEAVQRICQEVGVKVVYTPALKRAPISGATRWIHDTPLIQLTNRYKRYDVFWFTFFHEVGHILKHGKKHIFLEDMDYSDKDLRMEEEANEFAAKWLLTQDEESIIKNALPLTEADIVSFAKRFHTHPAVIVGRLQHQRILPYHAFSHLINSVDIGV